jgi:hypothetical protein
MATLRLVRPPLTLRVILKAPRRYFRCSGCRKVIIRRWRRDPDSRHLKAFTWAMCGYWAPIPASSAAAQRARLRGW